jgi:hypothetical protein
MATAGMELPTSTAWTANGKNKGDQATAGSILIIINDDGPGNNSGPPSRSANVLGWFIRGENDNRERRSVKVETDPFVAITVSRGDSG